MRRALEGPSRVGVAEDLEDHPGTLPPVSSRKEQKEAARAEREARQREAEAGARRKRLVGFGVAGALGLAALIAIAIVALGGGDGGSGSDVYPDGGSVPEVRETDLEAAARAAGCQLKDERAEGREHVQQPVQYKTNPPIAGNHYAEAAEDGVYSEAPAPENWVHSLEHGRMVVQFKPSLPADARADLKAFHEENDFHMLLMPNTTNMPFDVAASVWTRDPQPNGTGHLLGCPRFDDKVFDALTAFRTRYVDNDIPPENIP